MADQKAATDGLHRYHYTSDSGMCVFLDGAWVAYAEVAILIERLEADLAMWTGTAVELALDAARKEVAGE